MRFYRRWTDNQLACDLGIIEPLNHQGQNFVLAFRQVETGCRWLVGCLNQSLSSLGRECGTTGVRGADGPGQLIGRDNLQQIANGSGFQRVLDQFALFEAG